MKIDDSDHSQLWGSPNCECQEIPKSVFLISNIPNSQFQMSDSQFKIFKLNLNPQCTCTSLIHVDHHQEVKIVEVYAWKAGVVYWV